jgi:prepilin-type N-terminal cleavage/methylation domain-containing protein
VGVIIANLQGVRVLPDPSLAQTVQMHINMQRHTRHSHSAGFSLIELLIVVVIIGLVMLFTFPRAGRILDHTNVHGARTAIVNKLNATRIAARSSNRVALLRLTSNSLWLELRRLNSTTATDTIPGGVGLNKTYGVTITGPSSVKFDPHGMWLSGAQTYVVTKNGFSDSVVVNGYGRITR